jgi:hypothetical protein
MGDLHSQGGSISHVDLIESCATQRHKANVLAMEDIERARIQDVIHEGADRDTSFRQPSCMGTELLLKTVKFVAGTGVFCDKEFCNRRVWC